MNLGELETLTTYDIPVKVVVLNNFGDGMVKQWQKLFFKGRLSGERQVAAQEGLRQGGAGRRLPRSPCGSSARRTCARVIEEFVAFQGPAFLEVMVDQTPACIRWSARARLRRDDHRRSHRGAPREPDSSTGRIGNVLMSLEGPFWDVTAGRKPLPPGAVTLGFKLLEFDPARGAIRVQFEAKPEFLNPLGVVQGGFIAATLDDTLGPALVCTLPPGHFAPTIELKVNFIRRARSARPSAKTVSWRAAALSRFLGLSCARSRASSSPRRRRRRASCRSAEML